jgi:hypothetical protein
VTEIRESNIDKLIKFPDKIAKIVSLHASSGEYMQNMFGEQFAYGQREILLKYCGLDFSTQILGNLQHGVFGNKMPIDFRTPRYLNGRKSSFWVYSKETENLGRSLGYENVTAIGAPWFYLRDSVSLDKDYVHARNGILVMPAHSTPSAISISTKREKKQRAEAFRQIVGSQKATVCLHATDYCDPETTESFMEVGFKVTCIGTSSLTPRWSQAGNRVRSLRTLINLMSSHASLLTDDFGTHLFYATDLGMRIGIFPKIRELLKIAYVSEGDLDYVDSVQVQNDLTFINESMPQAIDQFTDSDKYLALAKQILGRESVLSPPELLRTLIYRKNIFPISSVQPW